MTTKDELETIGRGLGLLVDQVERVRADAVEAATRARLAIDEATRAEGKATTAEAVAMATRDNLVGLRAQLEAVAETLGDGGPVDPDPDPEPGPALPVLVSGPVGGVGPTRAEFHQLFRSGPGMGIPFRAWQSKAGYDNNAGTWQAYEGGLSVRMDPAHGTDPNKRAGSSESHEAWLYFDRRYREARMDLELKLVEPFGWPLTGKVAGIVGWNGQWPQWPGGGRSGPDNASVRLILNDWGHSGNARLGAYVYLGGVFDQGQVTGPAANYVSNQNHSVEYLLHEAGVPRAGDWIPIRIDTTCDEAGTGALKVWVDGDQVLDVDGLPWFVGGSDRGWNTGYVCGLFGGDAPEYNPRDGSRTIAYRNVAWSGR